MYGTVKASYKNPFLSLQFTNNIVEHERIRPSSSEWIGCQAMCIRFLQQKLNETFGNECILLVFGYSGYIFMISVAHVARYCYKYTCCCHNNSYFVVGSLVMFKMHSICLKWHWIALIKILNGTQYISRDKMVNMLADRLRTVRHN